MVAPTPGADPRKKWRHHCSRCGVKFAEPQLWAYCSKACEDERRGLDIAEGSGTDEWTVRLHDERLRLHEQLEVAPKYQRAEIVAAIMRNEAQEEAVRDELAVISAPRDSALFWVGPLQRDADRWERDVRRGLESSIRLGKRLVAAKAALAKTHGEFGRLFAENENAVPGALDLSQRWAQKLMSIAAHPMIAKASHATHLPIPADVEAVYLLSRLPAPELEAAIQRGDVWPEMKRPDARDLLPTADAEPAEPFDVVERALDPVTRALRRFAAEHASQFGDLKARLKAALRAIEREIAEGKESGGIELMKDADRGDMRP